MRQGPGTIPWDCRAHRCPGGPLYTPLVPLSPEAILSPNGPVARALEGAGDGGGGSDPSGEGGFESRPEQVAMAKAVAAALEERGRLLVEAGTGVGKSFAYLVPAILRCLLHNERVVVATNTIALQEQLIHKDIPLLQATLADWGLTGAPGPRSADPSIPRSLPTLRPVLVKGRANYASIRRLKLASQRQETLFADAAALRSLHVIEDWAYQTKDGSLSTLPALESTEPWDHARSDADNCMGRKCPHYKECFYQNARREMEQANLLICNHALFFSDLALRAGPEPVSDDDEEGDTATGEPARGSGKGGFLPEYQHVILDEAHNVEEVACEHFGLSLSQPRVMRLLRTLYQQRRGAGYLSTRALSLGDLESVDQAIQLVLRADAACRDFFDALLHLYEVDPDASGRLRSPGAVDNPLTPAMRDLALRLKGLRDAVESEPDRFELNSYVRRAEAIAGAAAALVDQTMPESVYWVEAQHGGVGGAARYRARGPRVTIACSPIEAAPLLRKHLFSMPVSVVMTSATLATRRVRGDEARQRAETAFAYTIGRLGAEGSRTLQLGSPFDHARQVRLYIDTSLPAPAGSLGQPDDLDGSTAAIADRILTHVKATRGGAFVLFTSFAQLNAVADALAGPLAESGLPMLVQNRDGSRSHILARFRADENSVLLGAASFWQGVDVKGRGLRNVIIARLPFEPPSRPLTQARLERIQERGGNPFMEDSLPRAVIRFKQGFGRLIRSKSDSGRVVVLDPRIVTARYGKRFLDALPDGVQIEPTDDGGPT